MKPKRYYRTNRTCHSAAETVKATKLSTQLKVCYKLSRRLHRVVLPTSKSIAYALYDNYKLSDHELVES